MFPPASDYFTNPDWFLAGLDADRGVLQYVRTEEAILRRTAFHDGRSPLQIAPNLIELPLAEGLAWSEAQPAMAEPPRLLAHVSFCGSTLLSQMIDQPGATLVYREPDALVQLANAAARAASSLEAQTQQLRHVRFVLRQFAKTRDGAHAVIKPSNWVNTILRDMLNVIPDLRLVIVETDLEDYLLANLRGGKSRLGFSIKLLNHFLAAHSAYRGQVLEVERAGLDSVDRLLRLLTLVFETQQNLLDEAALRAVRPVRRISKAQIQAQPVQAAMDCAVALDLDLSRDVAESAANRWQDQHAKDPASAFSLDDELAETERLRDLFADQLAATLDWRRTVLRAVA